MTMPKRVWFLASVTAALAGLVVGAQMLSGQVTRPMGALMIVFGLMPAAMFLAAIRDRRRTVGALHVAAGALFGISGFVLASRDNFLGVRLASIGWRVLAHSGYSLASVGWMAIGLALILTGAGVLTSRRTPAVLSALLVICTAGYFAVSLSVVPYLYGRRYGWSRLDPQSVVTGIVLVLVALLVIAALSRLSATGLTAVREVAGEDRAGRRWVRAAIWSACGTAAVAGISVWAWLTWGPRLVVAEVFPDAELASCVMQEMGRPASSTTVSASALSRVLVLPCNGHQVKDLRGLDTLTNLVSLGLADNSISDLTPLASLEKLGSIKLGQNEVSDLRPLAALPVLTSLGLSGNSIADLTPLAHIKNLSSLGLARNKVADLTPLARVKKLSFLDLSQNKVRDLTPLAGLSSLSTLDVSENGVFDVTPLAHLTQLGRLTLAGNSIGSPAPLRDLPTLSILNIARNRISDATTFAGFAALEELWVGGNPLTDVTPLADLASLTGVDFEGTDLGAKAGLETLKARNIYVGGLA